MWTKDEKQKVKCTLRENKDKTYSEIAEMIDVDRTAKAISHKNRREFGIERDLEPRGPDIGSGEDNINWKGGVTEHSRGYIMDYKPKHHRCKDKNNNYVFRHILVAEEKLGRNLKR